MSGDADRMRDMKILSDILALTLDEAPAVSVSALDAIRQRARASGVTGGALKEAFQRAREEAAFPRVSAPVRDEGASSLSRARMQIEALQSQVAAAESEQRRVVTGAGAQLRRARLLSLVTGLLLGVGCSVLGWAVMSGG